MDNIEVKDLEKKDYNKARKYAVKGMNLRIYTENNFELYIYSKYLIYSGLLEATQILGAYKNNELLGFLLADIKDEPKKVKSVWFSIYIKIVKFIMDIGYKNSVNVYAEVYDKMIKKFKQNNNPDGEIIFFAVNPEIKGKGIGTILLDELAKREQNKQLYLYTDSLCTYQFYDKRGFKRESEEDIKMKIHNKEKKLTSYLYSKQL